MLPLQSAEWYRAHPKPVNSQNNYDIPLFRQGLRIPEADYEPLVDHLTTAVNRNNIPFDSPTFNLRTSESRASVSPVLQSLIDKYSAKFGWDKINDDIVKNYLFEFFKRWLYNKKRSLPKTIKTIPEADPLTPTRPSVPVTPTGPSSQQSDFETLSRFIQGPTASGASHLSTPLLNRNTSQIHPLQVCTLLITRTNDSRSYEDTIDVFLKPEFRNSSSEHGPNDYDFSVFKGALTAELLYNEHAEILRYRHSQRGILDVDSDSKWRVALRDLSSQPSLGVLNFEIALQGTPGGLRGLPATVVSTQSTPSSPSAMQQGTAQATGPSSTSSADVLHKVATQAIDSPTDRSSLGDYTPYPTSGLATEAAQAQPLGTQVDNAMWISSNSNSPIQKSVANNVLLIESSNETQEAIAQTLVSLRDGPSKTPSTGKGKQVATSSTHFSSKDKSDLNEFRKRYAPLPSPWGGSASQKHTSGYLSLSGSAQDDEDDSDSDVPIKKRRTTKNTQEMSSAAESQNDNDLTDDEESHIIYDNHSDNEAEGVEQVEELTEEEHERL
jgi:hypothetical protein